MSDDLARLVHEYRPRGVLVDTNILLLFFIGSYDRGLVARFKRTSQFTARDYELVVNFLAAFERRFTTPHILAEVSNLAGQLPQHRRYDFYRVYAALLDRLFEVRPAATDVVTLPIFPRLALTDAAIEHVARDRYLVLTDDGPLAGHLRGAGIATINFADIRDLE